ncbi:MAG: hypothetical protein ACI9F9_001046 [Candidatus Paceibacteria bacterium]
MSDFRKRAAADPTDLALQHALALKLRNIGDQFAQDAIVAAILAQDPKGLAFIGARLLFWKVRGDALMNLNPETVDLKRVYQHMKTI